MSAILRKLLLALVAMGVLAGVGVLVLTRGQPVPLPPLPNPNGYDDFLAAGRLVPSSFSDAFLMETNALRELVSTKSEALRLFRLGLSRSCRVPPVTLSNVMAQMGDATSLKHLGLLVTAEGLVAESEQRPADAARAYVEVIRYGNEISRGGPVLQRLLGIGSEFDGLHAVVRISPQLNCELTRPVIAALEDVDKRAVTWEETLACENAFVRNQTRERKFDPIARLRLWWTGRKIFHSLETANHRLAARLRLLPAELALRCYRAEIGRAPDRLDQLVPKYLQRVPLDPFSDQPLRYLAQGTNWLLYSVGVDGVDDGGKRAGRPDADGVVLGDLFYDSVK